eukprot:5243570-Amphidinium_carterae.1
MLYSRVNCIKDKCETKLKLRFPRCFIFADFFFTMSCNRQVGQQLTHSMGDTTEESVGTQLEAQVMPMADTFDGRHHRR